MIHVMNPYKMSLAMFRLTSLGFEYQAQLLQALTKMAMVPVPREAQDEAEPAPETVTTRKAAKPARRSRGATKAATATARKTRKPSAPPTMPEPVVRVDPTEEGEAAENMPV